MLDDHQLTIESGGKIRQELSFDGDYFNIEAEDVLSARGATTAECSCGETFTGRMSAKDHLRLEAKFERFRSEGIPVPEEGGRIVDNDADVYVEFREIDPDYVEFYHSDLDDTFREDWELIEAFLTNDDEEYVAPE